MQGSADQNITSDITTKEAYNKLLNTSVEMAYLDTMISLSRWDQDTSMPRMRLDIELRLKATWRMKNKKWIDPEFGMLLSIANNGSNWSTIEASNLRLWNRDYNKRIKLPPDFAARESEMASLAQAAWENARKRQLHLIPAPI